MIIKTGNHKFMPQGKLMLALLLVACVAYGFGFFHGVSYTTNQCIKLGLQFVDIDVDEALVREAIEKYGFSEGYGALFNGQSPHRL